MDKNSILIILGIIVAINFIALLLLGRSSKKTPKAPKRKEENQGLEAYDDEPKGKTEMLSMPRQRGNSASIARDNPSITRDNPDFDRIPVLPDRVKNEIKREASPQINVPVRNEAPAGNVVKNDPVNATEFLSAEPEEKIYAVLKFVVEGSEHVFEMRKNEIFIGRDPELCDLIIPSDKYLGRKHAKIFMKDGKLFVEDLQSRNGTFINNTRISGTVEIVSGKFRLAFTDISVN